MRLSFALPVLYLLFLFATLSSLPFQAKAQPCYPPFSIGVFSLTYNSAIFGWPAASVSNGYEWAASTSSTPPATGAFTGLGQASINGLLPCTKYYIYVRNVCSVPGGGFSNWGVDSFTTLCCPPGCQAPVAAINNITSFSANASWPVVAGATNYEYMVDTSPLPPLTAGSLTPTSSVPVAGLNSSTQYYFHVRTNCGSTLSCWNTTPFTTLVSQCTAPSILTTNVNSSFASFSWSPVTTATGFEYVVDQLSSNPTFSTITSFLPGTQTTLVHNGLTSGTGYYYLHIERTAVEGIIPPG
jgi:hypothetical protein